MMYLFFIILENASPLGFYYNQDLNLSTRSFIEDGMSRRLSPIFFKKTRKKQFNEINVENISTPSLHILPVTKKLPSEIKPNAMKECSTRMQNRRGTRNLSQAELFSIHWH
jgi:hypothetical protein